MSVPLLLLGPTDVLALLDVDAGLTAMEGAFRASSGTAPPALCGVRGDGGGFHVKAAILAPAGGRAFFAAKVNGNFPANPRTRGLPTVQGLVVLFDGASGQPLALLYSPTLTALRTAAATAVAARRLASPDAAVATVVGCGVLGRAHLPFLRAVLNLRELLVFDPNESAARGAAAEAAALGMAATVVRDLHAATRRSDVIVTCTPSRHPLLDSGDVRRGAFVAGVGADNGEKHELTPGLLAGARVVVDVLAQCREIGDLHHALVAGAMREDDVHAELGDVISGAQPGRTCAEETFVFDSTGMALQDVAAAALVYERALTGGRGITVTLA